MPKVAPSFFTRIIERILTDNGVSKVLVAEPQDASAVQPSGMPNTHPVPRISVCLKGSAHYELACDGTLKTWEVHPGEAIFVPANSWMRVCADSDYDSLGIVFFHDLTRIIRVHSTDSIRRHPHYPFNLNREVLVWPHPLGETGLAYAEALSKRNDAPNGQLYSKSLLNLLLYSTLSLLKEEPVELEGGKPKLAWQAACGFVQDHLHLSVGREEVARFLHIHPNHVSRLFKQYGDCSFSEYVTKKRMDRARVMLADPSFNITDVALQCGFTSLSYFARVCHVELGLAPSEFRQAAALAAARRNKEKPGDS